MVRSAFKLFGFRRKTNRQPGKRLRACPLALEALEGRLAPAAAHFAVFGDYGTGEQPEQDVANLVHSWNPDFIATTCDNNYSNPPMTTASYDAMVGKYYHDFIYPYSGSYGSGATTNRFWPTMGDHDWGYDPSGDQAYLSFFSGLPGNRRYYTTTQGPVALFILDTYQSEPDGTSSISTQAQWLQSALASSTAPWKLVFLSDPPYSSGPFGSIGGVEWPFQAWGASAVFSGHDHGYERLFENGIPYFVVGTGGAGLDSPPTSVIAGSQAHANVFGALKVDATPSQISFSFANTAGTVLDTYTLNYTLPAAPNNLTATAVSGSQINLKWTDNSTNETGYDIERSTDGTTFTQIATAGQATTNYLDSGLTAGTTYYYRVAASNAGGNSAYSNTINATTPSPPGPSTGGPTNLTAAVASASQVNLAWTDNSGGLYSFQIERSPDGSNYSLVATVGAGVTSYADTGLAPATYYYQVVGTVSGASKGATAVVGAVLAPAAPANLTATAVSGTQINLKWTNNASNAAGINIQRSTDGTTFTQIATASPATTNYLDSGLTAGTTYYYRVAASNAGGNSAYSNTINATPPSPPGPSTGGPTNLTAAVASASQVNLAWTDNSGGLYSFQIERSPDGSNYSLVATVGAGVTSYADTGLAPATYYYQVVGTASGASKGATAVVGAVLAPAAPANLTATAVSATQIDLKWTNNASNAAGIIIQRSTDGTSFTQIATASPATTNYLDSGLTIGTAYYYRVAASNTGGSSAYSNTVNTTIPSSLVPPFGAPTNLTTAVASASQVNLAWTDNSGGLYSFQIERSTDGSNYSLVATVGMGVTTYTDTGLAPTIYYYQVVGMTALGGNMGATAVASAVLPPVAPGNLNATAVSGTQINVKWTDNSTNETGYDIQRSTDGTTFTLIATAGPATTNYLDSGLTAGTTYYYRVAAYNASGTSTYSNTGSATIQASGQPPASPPSNLTATVASASQVNLAWTDNSGGLYSYQIERSTDGSNYTLLTTTGAGATSYADKGLAAATYYYQVVATNNGGSTAVASAALAPAAPGNLNATAVSGAQINVKWTDNSTNETGYDIQRSTDGTTFTLIATGGPATTNYLDSGLTAGTTYYYRVAAYNASGTSAYSNTGSATIQASGQPPASPPSNLTATVASSSQVNLAWADNSGGLDSYQIERSTDGSNYTLIATTGMGATSYADKGLAAATYYYQVVATNNGGSTAVARAVLAPAAPGNLTATPFFSHQINLSWKNNASNATGINILESTDGVNFTSIATVGVYATTFSRWFLTPSTTYYYRVSATNATGAASSATANATTSAPTPPLAASNLKATAINAYTIKLSWTDNSNPPNVEEDGFALYKSTDGVNFNWTQTPGRDMTTYTDPDTLSPGTRYYYQIVAFNVDGWANPSNTAMAITPLTHLSRQLPSVGNPEHSLAVVSYHGGPLLRHVQVEAVYDGQAWSSSALQPQLQELDGFLNYFVDSPYVGALKQYHVSYGTFLGHHVVAGDSSGGQVIDDSQIRTLLDSEIAAKRLGAPSADRLYVFFTAPGVVVTADGQNSITDFAGYHGVFTDSSGAPVYYAVVPYPMGQISAQSLTALQQGTVILSHEVSEAITDPDTRSGWFDPRRGEIGDITAGQIGSLHGYTVQALWSQVDGKAVVPASTSDTPLPVTGLKVHATAGPLRAIAATTIGADSDAAVASFRAAINADGSPTSSPPAPNQGQPVLRTVLPQGTASESSAQTTTATAVGMSQQARVDSGGGDSLALTLEDKPSAAPQENDSSPAAVPALKPEAEPAVQSQAALWKEASRAYFAEEVLTDFSGDRATLPLWSATEEATPPSNLGAAAMGLALVLGSYWSTQPELTQTRRPLASDRSSRCIPRGRTS